MKNYLDDFIRELKNRNYAKNTIKTYSGHLKSFLTFSQKNELEPGKRIAVFLETKKNSSPLPVPPDRPWRGPSWPLECGRPQAPLNGLR